MNASDKLRFIASALLQDLPQTAKMLNDLASDVRKMEVTISEYEVDRQEDLVLVAFPQWNGPIKGTA